MDVRFLRGLASKFATITPDNKTFYFVTENENDATGKLYLGSQLLSNEVTSAEFSDLADRVAALEGKVDVTKVSTAIADAVKEVTDYITEHEGNWSEKTDISVLEDRMTAVEGVADAAQTAQEVSDAIDEKITALDLANTYDAKGAAATAETNAKGYADGLISAEVTRSNKYVDDKFADANLAQYTTEQEVKDIVDGVIAAAVEGDAIDNLTELVEYLNTHEGVATQMATDIGTLKTKVQTIEGKPAYGIENADITNWDNEVGAKALAQGVKDVVDAGKASWDSALHAADLEPYAKTADISADIAKGVEAQGWGNHANEGYLKAADISGKEDKANLKALAYKDIAEKSDLAADVQASLGKADTALQSHQNISHLATKEALETLSNDVYDGIEPRLATAEGDVSLAIQRVGAQEKITGAGFGEKSLTTVISENAQTCQSNFNTISEQLTWGSF